MTSAVNARIAANRDKKTVCLHLDLDESNAPDITLELESEKARELAEHLLRAADSADGLIAEA